MYKLKNKTIIIPDSVTTICQCAFSICPSLTSVTIGNGVKTIGEYAFWDCNSLKSVSYLGATDPGSSNTGVFAGTQVEKVKVPINYNSTTFCGIPVDKPRITKPLQRIKKFPRIFL